MPGGPRPRTGWPSRASPTSRGQRRRPGVRQLARASARREALGRRARPASRGRGNRSASYPDTAEMLNVLLTNDDGIEAEGLQAMRRALRRLEGVRLAVIAPDGNRSAMARSITTRRPLWVTEVPFSDG